MLIATATGNIGRDAEMKKVGESSVCEFSIACKTSFKKDADPTWLTCKLWGSRGDALVNHLRKGTRVVVSGSLSFRSYSTKAGEARVAYEIDVRDLDLMGGGERDEDRPKSNSRPASQPSRSGYDDSSEAPF